VPVEYPYSDPRDVSPAHTGALHRKHLAAAGFQVTIAPPNPS